MTQSRMKGSLHIIKFSSLVSECTAFIGISLKPNCIDDMLSIMIGRQHIRVMLFLILNVCRHECIYGLSRYRQIKTWKL